MFGIDPLYYQTVYYLLIIVLTVFFYQKITTLYDDDVLSIQADSLWMKAVYMFLILFIGLRPLHAVFGDTVIYARIFRYLHDGIHLLSTDRDWLWELFQGWASQVMKVQYFFLLVTIGYIVPMYFACRRLIVDKVDLLMVFCLGAFSFYSYAINGIRNGMACSIMLLALTFVEDEKKANLVFVALAVIAIGFHNSLMLPVGVAVFAYYYRSLIFMFRFWIGAIVLSLLLGPQLGEFFGDLGYDDRMASYVSEESLKQYNSYFSHTGFRWDFLLYSAPPIVLGWYVLFKREFYDFRYYLLLSTYIYSNAFWIMVIYATNSNRFAYLSWFLYPIVLAYPLLKFPVFKQNHTQKTAMILVAHLAFTLFMWLYR